MKNIAKRWWPIIVLAVLLTITICYGQDWVYLTNMDDKKVEPGQQHTGIIRWAVVDATTEADGEPAALGTDERTYITLLAAIAAAASESDGDGEISIYPLTSAMNRIRLRCIGADGDGALTTYQIYLGTLNALGTDCELAHVGQLAFTIGAQESTTDDYEMADTLTVTEYDWCKAWTSSTPANDRVCEATIDIMGANLLVALASATDTDCKLLMKGY